MKIGAVGLGNRIAHVFHELSQINQEAKLISYVDPLPIGKDYAEKHNAPNSFLNDIASIKTPSYAGKISKPDILLDEGRIKDVKRNLTTIFTPGHDRTEISLFDESTKIIFSGDHILPKITPFIPTDNENEDMLANYTQSLDKIYEIDHEIIAPGHGDIISKPHSRIEQMKAPRMPPRGSAKGMSE